MMDLTSHPAEWVSSRSRLTPPWTRLTKMTLKTCNKIQNWSTSKVLLEVALRAPTTSQRWMSVLKLRRRLVCESRGCFETKTGCVDAMRLTERRTLIVPVLSHPLRLNASQFAATKVVRFISYIFVVYVLLLFALAV